MTTQNNLLPISEIIRQAQKSGATLGHGDPKIHLAYLTKIRLLPQAVRRKVDGQIVGCYPESVVPLLKKIEEMKQAGLTYSQIKFQIHNTGLVKSEMGNRKLDTKAEIENWGYHLSSHFSPQNLTSQLSSPTSNGFAFLLIGLLLGFLLAVNNHTVPASQQSTTASLPTNNNVSPVIKLVNGENSSSDPIYLIAIPNQNLYKLGKTDINLLR